MNAREPLALLVGIPEISWRGATMADVFSASLQDRAFELRRSGNKLAFRLCEGPKRLSPDLHLDTAQPAKDRQRNLFASMPFGADPGRIRECCAFDRKSA